MDEAKCKDCQHFRQHYTFDRKRILRVYCGHCICSRARTKRPDTQACEHFVPGPADTEAFATKEYLSKELLQYVLNLELLPEITDAPVPPRSKRRGE